MDDFEPVESNIEGGLAFLLVLALLNTVYEPSRRLCTGPKTYIELEATKATLYRTFFSRRLGILVDLRPR
jgi:hypothetical protein